MLFMAIFSYEPENREEVIKRRAEGLFVPEGAKLHGQWSAIAGGRVFTLVEVNNPLEAVQCFQGYNNLGKFEMLPVIDTDALMKAFAAKK